MRSAHASSSCSPPSRAGRAADDRPGVYDMIRSPGTGSAARPAPSAPINLFYDTRKIVRQRLAPAVEQRAGNVNTIDDVPDSSWLPIASAPRRGTAQIARGGQLGHRAARSDGAAARKVGRTIPASRARWRRQRGSCSSTRPSSRAELGAVGSRDQAVLGRSATTRSRPITRFDLARSRIAEGQVRRPSGARTPFTRDDITRVLERAARTRTGTYAHRPTAAAGKVPDRSATRATADDPNDLVPHEHRASSARWRFGA